MNYKFPENFWWGAALSGIQTEGYAKMPNETLWDIFYREDPYRFYGKLLPKDQCNTYYNYKRDVQLMKDIKLNSIRTSIQWSRLIKNFETYEKNEDAIRFYRNYFTEMKDNGVEPVICLFHFDMPSYIQEKYGGFESKKVSKLYAKYARICFDEFGDIVKNWITFNEPIVPVEGGYLDDFHYPHKRDGKLAIQVAYNTIYAQALAIEEFKKSSCDGKIGSVLNITPIYPRSENKADVQAAKIADEIYNKSFMNPTVLGKFSEDFIELLRRDSALPEYTNEELEIIKMNTIDFIGLNYYVPRRVQARMSPFNEQIGWIPEKYFESYNLPARRINPYRDNNEIYPTALYDIAKRVQNEYNNVSWYLSEIGFAMDLESEGDEEIIDDRFRTEILREHLIELHKAIEEGSNCFGVHQWTFIDNWSWLNGYRRRYGFYRLNIDTGEIRIKQHALWFKKCIEENGFE